MHQTRVGAGRCMCLAVALAIVATAALLAGCGNRVKPATAQRIAVATIFPAYDFARRVGGDRFPVRLLLPPGAEIHGYEPKPGDLAAISKASLFIYVDDSLEPWAKDIVAAAGRPDLRVVVASAGISSSAKEAASGAAPSEAPIAGEAHDPHIWLDPILAAGMADAIADGMALADPEGAPLYRENAAALRKDLEALDLRIAKGLSNAATRTVVFGGHGTFGYFARRYNLDFVSPYKNFSPDSEPSASSVAQLLSVLKASGTGVVFYGELVEPRVARVLAEATGARLELLHGIHSLSSGEMASGANYFTLMEANLGKLEKALGAK